MLTIDHGEEHSKAPATETGEIVSTELSNKDELHSDTKNGGDEDTDSVAYEERLHVDSAANESLSRDEVDKPAGYSTNVISVKENVENQLESAEESGVENSDDVVNDDSGLEHEWMKEEESSSDNQQERFQFQHDSPPLEEIDQRQYDSETGQKETQAEDQTNVDADEESDLNEPYRRNPFDDWAEDPEGGNGFFGSQPHDIDNRPDPKSQGYTLLQDDDDSKIGNTSADVHGAEEGRTEDNFNLFSPEQQADQPTDEVAAFSQVQGSISQGVTGLKFIAHQLVDPSNPVPHEMQPEKAVEHDNGVTNPLDDKLWGLPDNEEFNFVTAEDQSNAFNSSNSAYQHFSTESEDPFAQILQSNGSHNTDPFATKGLFLPKEILTD